MKTIWSDFASETLLDILQYHKEIAGKNIAYKLKILYGTLSRAITFDLLKAVLATSFSIVAGIVLYFAGSFLVAIINPFVC